jgi:hypothetical protein
VAAGVDLSTGISEILTDIDKTDLMDYNYSLWHRMGDGSKYE